MFQIVLSRGLLTTKHDLEDKQTGSSELSENGAAAFLVLWAFPVIKLISRPSPSSMFPSSSKYSARLEVILLRSDLFKAPLGRGVVVSL